MFVQFALTSNPWAQKKLPARRGDFRYYLPDFRPIQDKDPKYLPIGQHTHVDNLYYHAGHQQCLGANIIPVFM
jgi:hypothetical protein